MARSKWISPFTPQQVQNRDSQKCAKPEDPPPTSTLPTEIKKFGLENFGNTCYANSVLQALFFCSPFRDLMLQHPDPSLPQDIFCPSSLPPSTTLTGPTKPPPALAPVRRKPERKPSSSSYPTEPSAPSAAQPQAISIPPAPPTLFSALRSLFYHIASQPAEKGFVAPKAFIDKLKELNDVFRSTMHQDAHEFLNYLLNQIVEEMDEERKQAQSAAQADELTASVATLSSKVPTVVTATSSNSGTPARDATLVHKLFEGILTSETRCLTCETVSARDESFLDLSIDIEQNSSVTACLRHFSASEMLCQKNKFFCDACCDLQEAEKRMKIKKLPNVLALHLKRFKYQEDLGRYIKLTYRVAFPMELRLFNTVDDMENADRLYTLFAIVVHIGTGPHQGHYISIIKTGGSWFIFDDDTVYPIAEVDITKYFGDSNSGSAYVLYYQAVDIDLAELGLQPREPAPVPDGSPTQNDASSSHPNPAEDTTIAAPPGLENERIAVEDPGDEPVAVPHSHLSLPDQGSLEPPPLSSSPGATDAGDLSSSLSTSSALPSPSAQGFGVKLLNTLRRAPSASLARSSTGANSSNPNGTTDRKRSGLERSPRPSASSPSLTENGALFNSDPPPPVPPLPPIIQTPDTPTTPMTPIVNLPPSEDKDKEKSSKKESSSSSKSGGGGWFSKRKSLKLSDRSKSSNGDTVSALPPSPSRRGEDSGSGPSGWFKGFGSSSHRDSQTTSHHSMSQTSDAGRSRDYSFDTDRRRSSKNGATTSYHHLSVGGGGGGNTDETPPTPGSTSSSLTSNSPAAHPPHFTRPLNGMSTSSSSSIPNHHPVPKSPSSSSTGERHRLNGVDRRKSKDSRSSSPSTSNHNRHQTPFPTSSKMVDLDRSLPPLPPTPSFVSHVHSPSNGHANVFVAEPKSYLNGNRPEFNEVNNYTYTSTSSSPGDDMTRSHLRSTTLPPLSSLASSAGANTSTSSTPPTTFGLRKASRKLSLTAPMLGFGRKDKRQS